jgi:carbamate kinase
VEDDFVVQDAGRRPDPPLMVVALGGNAISRAGDEPSVGAQFARTRATVDHLLAVIAAGDRRMVLTHGNGPQVGNILLRSDLAAEAGELPPLPVDSAVADTQGAMGYMIQQCLANALWESGIDIPVATVVTQVIVDEGDPAFSAPAKPIGRFYDDREVGALERHGWTLSRDAQGRGWRRVIASPAPREIVEVPVIRELVDAGVLVVACGGGGVPVIAGPSGALHGTEAVIDKDLASSLLARSLGATTLAILTDVEHAFLDYGAPTQRAIGEIEARDLAAVAEAGHFAAGSMGPKIAAALSFVEEGRRAIITSPECIAQALAGHTGTHVVASSQSSGVAR